MGGTAGGPSVSKVPVGEYDLPIKLKIDAIQPVSGSTRATLRLDIDNAGSSTLQIPSCLDPYAAFVPGAHNRRSLNFGVLIEPRGIGERHSEFVEVTSGSDSVRKCLTALAPGKTLVVVLNVTLPTEIAAAVDTEKGQPLLRAFVEEWKFEDSRYVISTKSKRIESEATTGGSPSF